MDTRQERLSRLDSALLDKRQICSSEGVLCAFPSALKSPFMIDGVGLIICRQGNFTFILNQKTFSAKAGDTLFLPKDSLFQVLQASDNVEVYIFIYQTDPIRDFMGNSVVSMHLYSHLATEPCYVWNTGEEEEVLKYLSLLDSTLKIEENPFNRYEQKLLLLALTHRLCSVYTRKLIAEKTSVSHKHDIFIRLVQLIEQYYTKERGVDFYADKLCLSPKYPLRPLQILADTRYRSWYSSPLSAKAFHYSRIHKRTYRKSPISSTSRTHPISALSSRNRLECRHSNTAECRETSYRYYAFSRITKRLPFPNSL